MRNSFLIICSWPLKTFILQKQIGFETAEINHFFTKSYVIDVFWNELPKLFKTLGWNLADA